MQSTPPGFFLRHPPVFSYYMQSIFPYITPLVYPVSRNRIRMIMMAMEIFTKEDLTRFQCFFSGRPRCPNYLPRPARKKTLTSL